MTNDFLEVSTELLTFTRDNIKEIGDDRDSHYNEYLAPIAYANLAIGTILVDIAYSLRKIANRE